MGVRLQPLLLQVYLSLCFAGDFQCLLQSLLPVRRRSIPGSTSRYCVPNLSQYCLRIKVIMKARCILSLGEEVIVLIRVADRPKTRPFLCSQILFESTCEMKNNEYVKFFNSIHLKNHSSRKAICYSLWCCAAYDGY